MRCKVCAVPLFLPANGKPQVADRCRNYKVVEGRTLEERRPVRLKVNADTPFIIFTGCALALVNGARYSQVGIGGIDVLPVK